MAIEITCDCGKGYRLSDDKAGKRFKCRDCGTLIRVPSAVADDPEFGDGDEETLGEPLPVRRRSQSASGSGKKKSRRKSSGSKRPLIIGGVIAVVALIAGAFAYASLKFSPQQLKVLGGAVAAVAYFVLYDQFCRYRIRGDVASYDGTVQSISWRPFQGAFFTRGWGRGKHAKFYEVSYTDRDGRTQHCLVCCHWFGTNWDV